MRKGIAVAAGVAILAALWWWQATAAVAPDTPASVPEPFRELPVREMPVRSLPEDAPDEPLPPPTPLVVVVGSAETWTMRNGRPSPGAAVALSMRTSADAWSTVPEATIPDGPWFGDDGRLLSWASHPEAIDAAEAAGALFGTPTTMGERLLEAELLSRWARVEHGELVRAYEARHGIPRSHDDPAARGAAIQAAKQQEPWPQAPTDEALQRLDTLVADETNPRALDVLELARLQLLLQPGVGRDSDEALDLAIELAAEAAHPRVQDDAIQFLADARAELTIPPDVLDALEELQVDESSQVLDIGLASLGLDAARRLDDPARTTRWIGHYRTSLRDWCAKSPTGPGCLRLGQQIDTVEGWLVSRGEATPTSWQAELVGRAHRCGEGLDRAELRGDGRFDGAWRWTVPDDPAFAACLTDGALQGPLPPREQRVALVVVNPAQR